ALSEETNVKLRKARHLVTHLTREHADLIRILGCAAALLAALGITIWLSSAAPQRAAQSATPPTPSSATTTNTSPPRSATPTPAQPPRPENPPQAAYTVQPGDTLAKIALRHGVPFELIATKNTITSPNRVTAGRRLSIPDRPYGVIVIPPGATLRSLAKQYGMSPTRLRSLNPHLHNPNRILSGAMLRVAGAVEA
ncbi:MAG: LysM peptidoglycan-binding domain-containing protein, partial [Actinomycetota bacterium]|nr:LysM peptidoglycan-binding domain-containing protein [Actinomycetota bacterium]